MLKFVLNVVVFSLLLSPVFARDVKVLFNTDAELRFDNISNYDDSDATTDDEAKNEGVFALELRPDLAFDFGQGVKIKTSWIFQALKESNGDSFYGEGLALDEFHLSFENDDAEFFIGKFNPGFAYHWQDAANAWYDDLSDYYQITGKIGLGGKVKMDLENYGKHYISINTFYYDDSNFSDSMISRRDLSNSNIGLASDTGALSSFTVNIASQDLDFFDGLFYNLGYRFLKNPSGLNIDDEAGYSVAFGFNKITLNNLILKPIIEYVSVENFNSFNNDFNQEYGDEQFLPADLESILFELSLRYGGWSFSYVYSDRQFDKLLEDGSIKVKDQGVSMSYKFSNNVEVRIGNRRSEQDDIDMTKDIMTVKILQSYNF